MRTPTAFVLMALGVALLIFGISAADSIASEVSNFFTGKPTDKAIWLLLLGVASLVGGIAMILVPKRLTRA